MTMTTGSDYAGRTGDSDGGAIGVGERRTGESGAGGNAEAAPAPAANGPISTGLVAQGLGKRFGRRPVLRIAQRDRSLAQQPRRAASSVALNLGEAEYSDPGNRRARFHTAAGSAGGTRIALQVAVAWGYLAPTQSREALQRLDRVRAILWRLTRGTA